MIAIKYRRPRVLDLFCGQGGAAKGYEMAGFDVVGVDSERQPRYPFSFIRDDALAFLDWMLAGNSDESFDLIHASPVCKGYSVSSLSHRRAGKKYPDQVGPVREKLKALGRPYVIENVPGAPLIDPVILCGSQFGLGAIVDGQLGALIRHRLFEASFPIADAGPHDHSGFPITIAGHGQPSWTRAHGIHAVRVPHWREAMGIDWMTRDGLAQAIPPAYTEYIGKEFLAYQRGDVAA
jgi:DNA (cytosine-5)-methyltransferase 1